MAEIPAPSLLPALGRRRLLRLLAEVFLPLLGANQALFLVPDQICPLRLLQSLYDQGPQVLASPLQQCPLQSLLVGTPGYIDLRHIPGVDARVVHTGGEGPRRGVKVLHLLRQMPGPVQKLRQTHAVPEGAARVGRHEVGHKVLLLVICLVETLVLAPKPLKHIEMGLAHIVQHRGNAVLRSHLQLAADVVVHQFLKKRLILVLEHIVVADAAANKHLLYPRQGPQPPQKLRVFRVVRIQILTRLRGQTASVFTAAVLLLPRAGGMAEVGRRPAHIMDVALELRVLRKDLRLPQNGLDAPGGDHPPLMKGQRAEVTAAEAAPVVGNGKPHLLNGRDGLLIHGMHLSHKGQVVEPVQLLPGQGALGRIYNEKPPLAGLHHAAAPNGVIFIVLELGGHGVCLFILQDALVGGYRHRPVYAFFRILAQKSRPPDIGNLLHRHFLGKAPGNFLGGRLSHAVHQQIRRRIKENGAAYLVVPVVIVGKAPQRRLQPADDNGGAASEGLPGPVGIHDGSPVRPTAHLTPRGIEVLVPAPLSHGVVGHHAVQVAPADEHAKSGLSHVGEGGAVVPVRLGQHRHPVALRLQKSGDKRAAEAGVVNVGVGHHHQKVVVVPLPSPHLLPAHRQKFRSSHACSPYPM